MLLKNGSIWILCWYASIEAYVFRALAVWDYDNKNNNNNEQKKYEIILKKNGWIESHSIVSSSVVSRYALMFFFVLFAYECEHVYK